MEPKALTGCLPALFIVYGMLLMASTFTYYTELQSAYDMTKPECNLIRNKTTRSWMESDFEDDFCNKIGAWMTCSVISLIAGILIVAFTIHSCEHAKMQKRRLELDIEEDIPPPALRQNEKIISFGSVITAGLTILLIILIDSRAYKMPAGAVGMKIELSHRLQPMAIGTLGVLALPSIAVFAASVVILSPCKSSS